MSDDADLVMAFAALGWAGTLTHLVQDHFGRCVPCECLAFCSKMMFEMDDVPESTLTNEEKWPL